jgi:hypothetical protein
MVGASSSLLIEVSSSLTAGVAAGSNTMATIADSTAEEEAISPVRSQDDDDLAPLVTSQNNEGSGVTTGHDAQAATSTYTYIRTHTTDTSHSQGKRRPEEQVTAPNDNTHASNTSMSVSVSSATSRNRPSVSRGNSSSSSSLGGLRQSRSPSRRDLNDHAPQTVCNVHIYSCQYSW